jgi:hypothetical protein
MKPLKDVIENIEFFSRQLSGELSGNPRKVKDFAEIAMVNCTQSNISLSDKETLLSHDIDVSADSLKEVSLNEITSEESIITHSSPSLTDNNCIPLPSSKTSEGGLSDEIKDISCLWKKTLDKIDPPLASKLLQADFEFDGNLFSLILNGGHSVFRDSISKNLKSIEKILSDEYGSKIKIKLSTSHKKTSPKNEMDKNIINEPVIKEALELFEGKIVDVIPLEKSEHANDGGDHV